jgi:hypothetical protein
MAQAWARSGGSSRGFVHQLRPFLCGKVEGDDVTRAVRVAAVDVKNAVQNDTAV